MAKSNSLQLDFELVKDLYYDKKYSAKQISQNLSVGLHTVYRYMRKNKLTRRDRRECNQLTHHNRELTYRLKEALSEEERCLKLAAIMLYWAEGAKSEKAKTLDFANSDPGMIQIFLIFLRNVCRISEAKLRVQLYCHSNQNISDLIAFWSGISNIPERQFTKPYIRSSESRSEHKMKYGLVHIRYHDKKLLIQMKSWIDSYCASLTNGSVPKRSTGADCKKLQPSIEMSGCTLQDNGES